MRGLRFTAVDREYCINLDVIAGPVGDGVIVQTMFLSREEVRDLVKELQKVLGESEE